MAFSPARAQALVPLAGVLALALFCTCHMLFRGSTTFAQDARKLTKAENPHWRKDACAQCHGQDTSAPIPQDKVDALCLRCHDGKAAASEIHPIGRPIDRKKMDFPAAWPLVKDRVACLTCHEVRPACDTETKRPEENMAMLRRAPADTSGAKAFCLSCHRQEQFTKFNPHLMLAADRSPVADKCLTCHKDVPTTQGIVKPTGKADLISDQFTLCKSCHPHHEDQFNPGHIGARAKPEMLAFMRARESIGLAATPSKDLVARLKADGARPTLLRPDEENTLKCSTCHNPHQAGMFKSGTPAAFGAMRVIGNRTVSPVRGEQFCSHCHSDI